MKQRPRIYYAESQRALMWERWRQGATLHQIARLFDRPHTSVRGVLAETGGIRPPARRRSRLADAGGARRDLQSRRWRSIDSYDRREARESSVNREP